MEIYASELRKNMNRRKWQRSDIILYKGVVRSQEHSEIMRIIIETLA